ncbi:MAG: hypothetical protein AAFV25_13930 [Bacteroidota bacterium]
MGTNFSFFQKQVSFCENNFCDKGHRHFNVLLRDQLEEFLKELGFLIHVVMTRGV